MVVHWSGWTGLDLTHTTHTWSVGSSPHHAFFFSPLAFYARCSCHYLYCLVLPTTPVIAACHTFADVDRTLPDRADWTGSRTPHHSTSAFGLCYVPYAHLTPHTRDRSFWVHAMPTTCLLPPAAFAKPSLLYPHCAIATAAQQFVSLRRRDISTTFVPAFYAPGGHSATPRPAWTAARFWITLRYRGSALPTTGTTARHLFSAVGCSSFFPCEPAWTPHIKHHRGWTTTPRSGTLQWTCCLRARTPLLHLLPTCLRLSAAAAPSG